MKVLSLNLHCFQEENRVEKLNRVADFIKENDIDVCLFQEVCQEHKNVVLENNIKMGNSANHIKNKLGYNIYYHPVKIGFEIYDEGLAIISKLPITNTNHKTISYTTNYNQWHKRDLIWCKVGQYTFFNVHVGWTHENEVGMNQINKIIEELNRHEERYFIAGDFNHPDGSDEIKHFKKYVYSLADLAKIEPQLNPTFHNDLDSNIFGSNQMIDFIFTNMICEVKDFKIVFNKESDYVSDHNGILVEI